VVTELVILNSRYMQFTIAEIMYCWPWRVHQLVQLYILNKWHI